MRVRLPNYHLPYRGEGLIGHNLLIEIALLIISGKLH
jgi:hypothetical protein